MFSKVDETKNPSKFSRGSIEETYAFLSRDAGETRTHGQWLKRPLLYQLSYRVKIDLKFTKNKKLIS